MITFEPLIVTQACFPYRNTNPQKDSLRKQIGDMALVVRGNPNFGVPHGLYPRLIFLWLMHEAVRTNSREIILGPSMNHLMSKFGLLPGISVFFKKQLLNLLSSSFYYGKVTDDFDKWTEFGIVSGYILWRECKYPKVLLHPCFFEEVMRRPFMINFKLLKRLKISPIAVDLYSWLIYGLTYLPKATEFSWPLLQQYFGAGYTTEQGKAIFQMRLLKNLRRVMSVYEPAREVQISKFGLVLVPRRRRRSR